MLSLCGYEAVNHLGIVYVVLWGQRGTPLLLNLINPSIDGLSSHHSTYHYPPPPNLGEWPNAYCHLNGLRHHSFEFFVPFFLAMSLPIVGLMGRTLFDHRACRNTWPTDRPSTGHTRSLDTSTEQAPMPHGQGTPMPAVLTQVQWYQMTTSTMTKTLSCPSVRSSVPPWHIGAPPYPIRFRSTPTIYISTQNRRKYHTATPRKGPEVGRTGSSGSEIVKDATPVHLSYDK